MRRKLLILAGAVLLGAALCLGGYNLWEDHRAGAQAAQTVAALREHRAEVTAPIPVQTDPPRPAEDPIPSEEPQLPAELPVTEVDGRGYIGTLDIPALALSLPVLDAWSYPNLKVAPCRYSGSAYRDDMIVAGHDYRSHFGSLRRLEPGQEVRFTDGLGNVFPYAVAELEVLAPTAVEEMETEEWDLTLFTCARGGKARLAVRCTRAD